MRYGKTYHIQYANRDERIDIRRFLISVIIPLIIVLIISGYELKLLSSELLIGRMISREIDYNKFREMKLGEDITNKAKEQAQVLQEKYPELRKLPYLDEAGCITYSMMAASYDLENHKLVSDSLFRRGIVRLVRTQQFKELYDYYKAITMDLSCFPVPKVEGGNADIYYSDSWFMPRTYGGERKHEGTDVMASNNLRGYFPVISITDGVVEKMGWLEQGGNRIGIRSEAGGYFYYAHLYSYAPGLEIGKPVIAGQLLGFMGDSGYGKEGTVGKFDVHLHLGIYVNTDKGEMSVNPFMILKGLENTRTVYRIQE